LQIINLVPISSQKRKKRMREGKPKKRKGEERRRIREVACRKSKLSSLMHLISIAQQRNEKIIKKGEKSRKGRERTREETKTATLLLVSDNVMKNLAENLWPRKNLRLHELIDPGNKDTSTLNGSVRPIEILVQTSKHLIVLVTCKKSVLSKSINLMSERLAQIQNRYKQGKQKEKKRKEARRNKWRLARTKNGSSSL
jgi:hypothetical protein